MLITRPTLCLCSNESSIWRLFGYIPLPTLFSPTVPFLSPCRELSSQLTATAAAKAEEKEEGRKFGNFATATDFKLKLIGFVSLHWFPFYCCWCCYLICFTFPLATLRIFSAIFIYLSEVVSLFVLSLLWQGWMLYLNLVFIFSLEYY